jgi:hypothetical protein
MADYALIDAPIKTWFDGAVIHLVVVDPELVDEKGERPNLRLYTPAERRATRARVDATALAETASTRPAKRTVASRGRGPVSQRRLSGPGCSADGPARFPRGRQVNRADDLLPPGGRHLSYACHSANPR